MKNTAHFLLHRVKCDIKKNIETLTRLCIEVIPKEIFPYLFQQTERGAKRTVFIGDDYIYHTQENKAEDNKI